MRTEKFLTTGTGVPVPLLYVSGPKALKVPARATAGARLPIDAARRNFLTRAVVVTSRPVDDRRRAGVRAHSILQPSQEGLAGANVQVRIRSSRMRTECVLKAGCCQVLFCRSDLRISSGFPGHAQGRAASANALSSTSAAWSASSIALRTGKMPACARACICEKVPLLCTEEAPSSRPGHARLA